MCAQGELSEDAQDPGYEPRPPPSLGQHRHRAWLQALLRLKGHHAPTVGMQGKISRKSWGVAQLAFLCSFLDLGSRLLEPQALNYVVLVSRLLDAMVRM